MPLRRFAGRSRSSQCSGRSVLAACGRVPGQFEILNDQVPQISGNSCTIPVNPTVYQGEGTLDISIVRGDFQSAYFVFP